MRPAVGRSKPATSRSTVVLPDPDGPSMEKNSPSRMSRSRSATAVVSPNVLRRRVREMATDMSGVCQDCAADSLVPTSNLRGFALHQGPAPRIPRKLADCGALGSSTTRAAGPQRPHEPGTREPALESSGLALERL